MRVSRISNKILSLIINVTKGYKHNKLMQFKHIFQKNYVKEMNKIKCIDINNKVIRTLRKLISRLK